MGNAPLMSPWVFSSVASGFKVYYMNGSLGFTSPTWNGSAGNTYPAVNIGGDAVTVSATQMSIVYFAGIPGGTYSVETSPDFKTWSASGVSLSAPDANNFITATAPKTDPAASCTSR